MADRVTMAAPSRVTDGAVALGVGLIVALGLAAGTAGRRRRRKEPPTRAEKRAALVTYLREHLSGADLAVHVVERLRRAQTTTDERQFFSWLYEQLTADRDVVTAILTTLGESSLSPKRLVGQTSGSILKLMAGGSAGDLSLFRTLEALAIGVQGKRCMWRALQTVHGLRLPPGKTFPDLESAAVRQWEAIEQRRQSLVGQTFEAMSGQLHA
jgi:hypothetical protein